MEISFLSIRDGKVAANLTVIYLQLLDKVLGNTNDELRSAIYQIQHGFLSYTFKKFNFLWSLPLNHKVCIALTTELLEADVFTTG